MDEIYQYFELEMTPGKVMPVIRVSQFDTKQTLDIQLMDNGEPYFLGFDVINVHPYLVARRPDGVQVEILCDNRSATGFVSKALHEDYTAVAGNVICGVRIDYPNGSIRSGNFILGVEKAPERV